MKINWFAAFIAPSILILNGVFWGVIAHLGYVQDDIYPVVNL